MKAYFPKRIFWRSFWTHVSAYFFVVLFGIGVGYWFLVPELGLSSQEQFRRLVGPWLLKVLPLLMIYMVMVSLWFSYYSVKPLAGIIRTVRSMVNRRGLKAAELDDDEVFEEEEGEFYELDVALSRVRRKLKKKYDQLDQLREESETLMMAMADAVVSVDGHQRLVFFNSHFAKHFLMKEQTEGTIYFSDILRDPELLSLVHRCISSGIIGERTLSLKSHLEGRERDYGVSVSPLRRPGEGPIYGALVVFHDITHLKAAERMRIEFLSNVSHELRTPLTTVKGYIDLLNEDVETGKFEGTKQFVPILSRNINRLVDLVNDLLLISKLESSPDLQIEVNDTHRISDSIKEEFSQALKEKGQEIVVKAEAPVLKADSVKLQQIIRNLISNAIRYGPERGKIELEWIPVKGGIEVRVKDQGQGISEHHQARLFERFYRVDKGRSRELGGTGLGLAIVKHLMVAHRGTVSVKSQLGRGSEFVCYFPQS